MFGFLNDHKVSILVGMLAVATTLGGVRLIPGAITTPAYAVEQIQASMAKRDSAVDAFHTSITARVDSTKEDVKLLTQWAAASTRLTCEQLGRVKAESYGYPCHSATLRLPTP